MADEMRTYVVGLLETYRKRMDQIALLHYELEHPAGVTPEEMIDAMAFGHSDGDIRSKGHISNKTLYIAMNYQGQMDRINSESRDDLVKCLIDLEREQDRLTYYINLLDDKQATVIRQFYFEGHTWAEIAEELHVVLRTVYKIKDRALNRLASMYAFSENSHP